VQRVDLTSCDTEPIHIIGAVQPHGALIAADGADGTIGFASANAGDLLGIEASDLLGKPLEFVLGREGVQELGRRDLAPLKPDLLKPWFVRLPGGAEGPSLECFPHAHEGRVILEFVPFSNGPALVWEEDLMRQRIISELIKPETLTELARAAAQILREVTGFDRVMIYRFADDRHGEVIAESTVRHDSFLGLHYPASDIPDPARRHFALNVIRTIPDIHARPVPIMTHRGGVADATGGDPLDLTYSKLRAVAPVHVEYLGNMGVGASLSISLTSNDDLWGLVACHHYGPLHLPWSRFRFCELLGGTISALLQSLENATQLRQGMRAERTAFDIEREARSGRPLRDVVSDHADSLMLHAHAQGMVLSIDNRRSVFGRLPRPLPDFASLGGELSDGVATQDNLPATVPMEPAQWRDASGAAFLELSEDGQDYLVFLREEFEQTIRWAGKPEKLGTRLADGTLRLSPRGSFALWSEERQGRSRPFSDSDREALRIIRRALFALNSLDRERMAVAAQKEAEAEEARLRLIVLDATRRSSMGELASALAHELNQPLAAVTNYVNACRQELRNYGLEIPEAVNGLIDNAVAESSRAANLVRRLRNFIAEGELVAERIDLAQVVRQGVDLALASSKEPAPRIVVDFAPDLPAIWADPIQIGQVVLNLVRNALPAMREAERREIVITARPSGEHVAISVRDSGHGIAEEVAATIFEPFHSSTTRGMGIGLSLCRSIVEAHGGRIRLRRSEGGAEFVFTLPLSGVGHEATM
jgi:chemotaxis family two-component system sensor kinase Cph1